MFFVKKNVIKIFIHNSKMLIVDYIYKTNKYKIFLIIIVNQTVFEPIFFINFAFIANEKQNKFA